jgi:hypothetical protein
MLGAAVGGVTANFAEEMREEERKHKKRRQQYRDGYDSY